MKRPTDLIAAFTVSIALHGIAAVCLGNMFSLMNGGIVPLFKEGESAVKLSLVSLRHEDIREPVKGPEQKLPAAVEIAERENRLSDESPSDNDADLLDKGVETSSPLDNIQIKHRARYPFGARLRGEEGLVMVRVEINTAGRAEKVDVTGSSGYPALDRAAVKAVKEAWFVRGDGSILGGEIVLSFRFKLTD